MEAIHTSNKSLKVLLVGDSLTKGYYNHGRSHHPYEIKLEELLKHWARGEVYFQLHEHGVSGEVTDRMALRLRRLLERNKDQAFDVVCVLGGTNDLGYGVPPAELFRNLEAMYRSVREHNPHAFLVTMTIPQSYVTDADYIKHRQEANALIKSYTDNNLINVDIESLIPFFKSPGEVDPSITDDGLHFTVAGYDRVGELVFAALEPHLRNIVGQAPVRKLTAKVEADDEEDEFDDDDDDEEDVKKEKKGSKCSLC